MDILIILLFVIVGEVIGYLWLFHLRIEREREVLAQVIAELSPEDQELLKKYPITLAEIHATPIDPTVGEETLDW